MKYTEFRDAIVADLKADPVGKTWKELKRDLNLSYQQPCPEWIARLEVEIGLERREKRGNALVWKLVEA
ncbi:MULTISPECIES: hypothetical protein [unclassified Lentimonas]|uniref:hypothetical protein n=1 Tax=unclassified Lentimonas TaxID=2630993 RepID=UPI001323BAE9|nr:MULTISPECIES: hypothetical protein [unclassified Lentimonas]CAA6676466.1 Unannotated [Lentimonas sp. CC4]CAA6685306.1 Unannotated [Lentimonas sp. CC6]CAA6690283.1 Unannotated [Lentimonas sp. CC10]CAA6697696.1 Unannotated [Lentimonas sp. CC19]CAA7069067.1 Unannotated [Lentimonas sp. CC11]